MRNILIIGFMVVSLGYMFVVMSDKYDNIKATKNKTEQQQNK